MSDSNLKVSKEWREEHMLTVEKFIKYLSQFDPKALVMQFELNTGDWQEVSPSQLSMLVHTAKSEREWLQKNPQFFRDGNMEKEIEDMMKYTNENDVVVRF